MGNALFQILHADAKGYVEDVRNEQLNSIIMPKGQIWRCTKCSKNPTPVHKTEFGEEVTMLCLSLSLHEEISQLKLRRHIAKSHNIIMHLRSHVRSINTKGGVAFADRRRRLTGDSPETVDLNPKLWYNVRNEQLNSITMPKEQIWRCTKCSKHTTLVSKYTRQHLSIYI